MNERVLVTGGRGSIGMRLVARLRELGHSVDVYDSLDGQDICNVERFVDALKGIPTVFHLAAVANLNHSRSDPLETMRVNVEGTWKVAYACRQVGARLYYASTCCVYGNQGSHPTTEGDLPHPAEIYACSKLAGERVIEGMHHTFGLVYNHMRFATVYGPGVRPELATHVFLSQALRGEPITVHGDGRQTRTVTYLDDLVEGVVALYQSGEVNDVWNISTEEEISALQMALDIRELAQSSSELKFLPQRIGQIFREAISAQKMRDRVGWQAGTTWREGISRMWEWLVANKREGRDVASMGS